MSIAEINDKYSFKECNKKEELEIGKPYKIINITKMETKFGPSILVTLEDGKSIFLPKRYDFTQEEIKKLTNGCSTLIYRGEKNVGKPLPAAVFEFAEWTKISNEIYPTDLYTAFPDHTLFCYTCQKCYCFCENSIKKHTYIRRNEHNLLCQEQIFESP